MKALRIALNNGEIIELDTDTVETISFIEKEDAPIDPVIEEPEPVAEIPAEPVEEIVIDATDMGAETISAPNDEVTPIVTAEPEEAVIPTTEIPIHAEIVNDAPTVSEPAEETVTEETVVEEVVPEAPAEEITSDIDDIIDEIVGGGDSAPVVEDTPAEVVSEPEPVPEVPKEEPKKEQTTIVFEGA